MSASNYLFAHTTDSVDRKSFAKPLANPLKSVTTSVCEIGDISFANGNKLEKQYEEIIRLP